MAIGQAPVARNSAGLIERARRLHLLGSPYAALVAARLPARSASAKPIPKRAKRHYCAFRRVGCRATFQRAGALRDARSPTIVARRRRAGTLEGRLPHDTSSLEQVRALADRIRAEIGKASWARTNVDHLLIALVAQGHVLLEGAPGTAKTLLAQCFGAAAGLDSAAYSSRPIAAGDILGSNLFKLPDQQFTLTRGPIFRELLRTTDQPHPGPRPRPRCCEAISGARVTLDGTTHALSERFMVCATRTR